MGKMRCNNLPLFRRLGTLLQTVLVLSRQIVAYQSYRMRISELVAAALDGVERSGAPHPTAFFSAPELLALANLNGKDYIFSA